MNAVVHSINISTEGGVPKLPIDKGEILFAGVRGDFNRFRAEKKNGIGTRAVTLFSLEQIKKLKSEGHAIDVGTTGENITCLLYTSPSPRDRQKSRMPSSA